jgi:hypothetical protein
MTGTRIGSGRNSRVTGRLQIDGFTQATRWRMRISGSIADMTSPSRGALMRPSDAEQGTLETKRAQGMPGAGRNPWPACRKIAGGSHHRSSRTSGIPCAMGLRLIRALPGAPGFLATITCAMLLASTQTWHQRRDARTTRLQRPRRPRTRTTTANRQQHWTKPVDIARLDDIVAATASRPACRDDRAYAPLNRGGTVRIRPLIWGWSQGKFLIIGIRVMR